MNILEGLFFGTQVPFDEVDVNCPEYYKAGDKAEQVKTKILERNPELAQLMEDYHNAQMEQINIGAYHHFAVGFKVGAQLMLEMLKEL
ncbi:MAG: hypothetical protein NC299_16660 [Lachnospiraceae bacterium]|nr:hypothetical protein [Ruminococcus sp.]MCM1276968.1 hypothetical protein [Lachnospiraceae bacterium]